MKLRFAFPINLQLGMFLKFQVYLLILVLFASVSEILCSDLSYG